MITKIKKICYVLLLVSLLSCEDSNKIDKDLVKLYVELRIAGQEFGDTENGKATMLQILNKYGFSITDFENKINKIKSNPDNWGHFQQSVISCLDSMAQSPP